MNSSDESGSSFNVNHGSFSNPPLSAMNSGKNSANNSARNKVTDIKYAHLAELKRMEKRNRGRTPQTPRDFEATKEPTKGERTESIIEVSASETSDYSDGIIKVGPVSSTGPVARKSANTNIL